MPSNVVSNLILTISFITYLTKNVAAFILGKTWKRNFPPIKAQPPKENYLQSRAWEIGKVWAQVCSILGDKFRLVGREWVACRDLGVMMQEFITNRYKKNVQQ